MQGGGQFVVTHPFCDDAVGQRGRQYRNILDNGLSATDDIADGGVGQVIGDVAFQCSLGLVLGGLEDLGVKARHPAFGFVDGAAVGEIGGQFLGIDATDLYGIQTGQDVVLLEAGVKLYPAVGSPGVCTSGGIKINGGFHPQVFKTDFADLATRDDGGDRNTARGSIIGSGVDTLKASGPVLERLGRDIEGAVDVARRDLRGAQQGDGQAGDIHAVAAFNPF